MNNFNCPKCGAPLQVLSTGNDVVSYICKNCGKTVYMLAEDVVPAPADNSAVEQFKPSEPEIPMSGMGPDYPPVPEADKHPENVNHPSHYNQGGVECIDAIKSVTDGLNGIEGFCTANAIKYLWRWKYKNGIEDLEKAKWYIDYLEKIIKANGCK